MRAAVPTLGTRLYVARWYLAAAAIAAWFVLFVPPPFRFWVALGMLVVVAVAFLAPEEGEG